MNVYEIVTNAIINKLEQGEIIWKKTWNAQTQAPRNFHSGKLYSGINVFLLLSGHYQSPYFMTYKQAADKGGTVRKGEKGLPIVFYSKIEKEDHNGDKKEVAFLRYYTVFNVSQIDGLKDVPAVEAHTISEDGAEEVDLAESIINGMPCRPSILAGFTRASYNPTDDAVKMPTWNSFDSKQEYYSTLFHELAHSTGHASRLNRHETIKNHNFGSVDYSKEELVAEFSSAFLCAEAGISPTVIDNQAAYIQGWLKALKHDSKLLVNAAAQAQKATNYILDRKEVI